MNKQKVKHPGSVTAGDPGTKTSHTPVRVTAAIFDYDGTILDSMPMWSSVPSRFVRSLGGRPEPGLDKLIKQMSLEEGTKLFRRYGAVGTEEEIVDQIMEVVLESYEKELQLKPGILRVLDDLREQGIRMCIATQTPNRMIRAANQRLGLDQYFEEVFSCGDLNTNKREPRIYEVAAGYLQAAPSETLVFEDIWYAVETASKAGFPVIGIYDESSAADRERIEKTCRRYLDNYDAWPGLSNLLRDL